jgi:hypothetical protein
MSTPSTATHLTPSQRFYRGEISLADATRAELAIARDEERTVRFSSPVLYYAANAVLLLLFPIALLIGLISRKDGA